MYIYKMLEVGFVLYLLVLLFALENVYIMFQSRNNKYMLYLVDLDEFFIVIWSQLL